MIGSLPYYNSPVMAVSGAAAKIRRALGDLTPQVVAEPTVESVLERMRMLNARLLGILRAAPQTPRVQEMAQTLQRAFVAAASDVRYAPASDADHIIEDLEHRVDDFQRAVIQESVVTIPDAPGQTRGFPGGTSGLLLAAVVLVAVGSVVLIAKPRKRRRR